MEALQIASWTPSQTRGCAACGMLVEPETAFHPYLYCQLFKLGVKNPARFLEDQRFMPDPAHWGKDAPRRQCDAATRP